MDFGITQIVAIVVFLFGGGAGGWVLAKVIAEKKLRGPGDKRSDIELGVKLLTDAQENDRKDREINDKQIATLRGWVNDLNVAAQANYSERQDLYNRVNELNERIAELVERNAEKTQRIRELETRIRIVSQKLIRGETVTLADLAGAVDDFDGHQQDDLQST
jgi:chromosome segregation ATPase